MKNKNQIKIGTNYHNNRHPSRLYHIVEIHRAKDDILMTKYYENGSPAWIYGLITRSILDLGIAAGHITLQQTKTTTSTAELKMSWTEPPPTAPRDRQCQHCHHILRAAGNGFCCAITPSNKSACGQKKVKYHQPACYYYNPRTGDDLSCPHAVNVAQGVKK